MISKIIGMYGSTYKDDKGNDRWVKNFTYKPKFPHMRYRLQKSANKFDKRWRKINFVPHYWDVSIFTTCWNCKIQLFFWIKLVIFCRQNFNISFQSSEVQKSHPREGEMFQNIRKLCNVKTKDQEILCIKTGKKSLSQSIESQNCCFSLLPPTRFSWHFWFPLESKQFIRKCIN